MRAVLALASTLLVITLLLNHAEDVFPGQPRSRGADATLDVIVAAKGALLPSGFLGAGPERIGEAIRIGERVLTRGRDQAGLRVATLGPGLVFEGQRTFDVAGSPSDVLELGEHIDGLPAGSLLLVGSSGAIDPEGADRERNAGALAALAASLGARARPFDALDASESWALITARLSGGWTPLAEAYSRDSGVVLAFSIAYDLERYAGRRGEFVEVNAGDAVEVFLEEELANAARCDQEIECTIEHTVGGRPMRSILQRPAAGASRVAWKGVRLGDGSGLRAMVGLADGVRAGSDGVTFEVRVDGELVHAQRAEPDGTWRLLQVDLRRFAGRSVDLELAVEPGPDATGDWALWGRPMLLHGVQGPSGNPDGAGR